MNWFSDRRIIPSSKNSKIVVTRRLGKWQVSVDGIEQTGPEVHEFWEYAFSMVALYQGAQRISKVLMLGLGAGGEVRGLNEKFKQPGITAVEYDPEMFALAEKLQLQKPFPFPAVIVKDAQDALRELQGTFDLIVVDLFDGAEPSRLAEKQDFLNALDARLSRGGFLLVNVYKDEALLGAYQEKFLLLKKWRFNLNHFGLSQKHELLESIREGYAPYRSWPELNTLDIIPKFSQPSRIGKKGEGVYWTLWPFSFESYLQDEEPELAELPDGKKKPFRIVMWQRRTRPDTPKEWWTFSNQPFLKVGFSPLEGGGYEKSWSENAKRQLKKWRTLFNGKVYKIRSLSYEEFAENYLKSTLPLLMRDSMLYEVKIRMKNEKIPVTFFGVERISDGKIVAGFSAMESGTLKISYYLAGFFKKEAEHDPVMVGLFDFWFQDALGRGLKFIDFGNFWKPGDESSWKGFSLFKAKFNPLYFFYPAKLYKFSLSGKFPVRNRKHEACDSLFLEARELMRQVFFQ